MNEQSTQSERPAPLEDYMPASSSKTGDEAAEMHPVQDLRAYVKRFAKQQPEKAALWCFGVGFVVGWKMKPW